MEKIKYMVIIHSLKVHHIAKVSPKDERCDGEMAVRNSERQLVRFSQKQGYWNAHDYYSSQEKGDDLQNIYQVQYTLMLSDILRRFYWY